MVNKAYWSKLELVKASFDKSKTEVSSGSTFFQVTLHDFFSVQDYAKIKQELHQLKFKPEKNPLTHSYSVGKSPALTKLFNTKSILEFISGVVRKSVKSVTAAAYSFSGRDYTILNDSKNRDNTYDLILDCTEGWDTSWGGSVIYVDGKGNYFPIPLKPNTLTIVKRSGIKGFVKYLNNFAGTKNRVIVSLVIGPKQKLL
ncbi:MAG TPA: hypothetical protein VJC39_05295 [Candidatus Nanoarchaeia archaeon]|nr:hypothetical protein [Candidatus Nanoarchaeia archaeon]